MQARKWPAVMVDLETLGTSAKAAVFEIGAVCFDLVARELGPQLDVRITLESNAEQGRVIEPGTLAWWMSRWRDEARVPDLTQGVKLEGAMHELREFWNLHAQPGAEFWSRGSFDDVILRDMAAPLGGVPWKYWSVRDQRTVTKWEKVEIYGEASHSALEDAVSQVQVLFGVLARKGGTR